MQNSKEFLNVYDLLYYLSRPICISKLFTYLLSYKETRILTFILISKHNLGHPNRIWSPYPLRVARTNLDCNRLAAQLMTSPLLLDENALELCRESFA